MTAGQRLLVSTCKSLARVLASVSRRCARRSASASGPRATSSPWRAAECAASVRSDVASELNEPPVELGHAVLGTLLLALEGFPRHHQPLQGGGRAGLGLAQGRQLRRRQRLAGGGFGLLAGALGNQALGGRLGVLGL